MENINGRSSCCAVKEKGRSNRSFAPRCDIFEREDALVVQADVPGADEKDIELSLEKNVLTINARVNADKVEGKLLGREYAAGDYKRVLHFSDEIDTDRIEATAKNGVLRIVLPKSERMKPRKIQVRTH